MYAKQRREEIFKLTKDRQFISVTELSKRFGVSEVTIRTDLRKLEEIGKVDRNYGGATVRDSSMLPFSERALLLDDVKKAIAHKAAALIKSGQSIFLDASTTTLYLAYLANDIDNLNIISNSIPVFEQLKEYRKGTLIGIPGTLNPVTQSFVGPFAEEMISKLRANLAFISPRGIIHEGLREQIMLEATLRKRMIDAADEVIVLADHSKFDTPNALLSIDSFDSISTVITDREPPHEFQPIFKSKGIRLLIAETQEETT
ncbi:DeoR/GlpR family DNA-binding transcription regulator [Cohnella zeiphila]|uniref:DeoR/GlpR transcriptional regulator n=1 Tax=Cohnella zeiphila TaxID=2761120 RepID=A0A7X0SN94_9BACL|nr:DeoR/GlpR family DNA-binding transcription regulator [Cohnella zeiphila]MBB6730863.1 DeoR/GlpR transcriptional regulator [Cohnella zeiphila]